MTTKMMFWLCTFIALMRWCIPVWPLTRPDLPVARSAVRRWRAWWEGALEQCRDVWPSCQLVEVNRSHAQLQVQQNSLVMENDLKVLPVWVHISRGQIMNLLPGSCHMNIVPVIVRQCRLSRIFNPVKIDYEQGKVHICRYFCCTQD